VGGLPACRAVHSRSGSAEGAALSRGNRLLGCAFMLIWLTSRDAVNARSVAGTLRVPGQMPRGLRLLLSGQPLTVWETGVPWDEAGSPDPAASGEGWCCPPPSALPGDSGCRRRRCPRPPTGPVALPGPARPRRSGHLQDSSTPWWRGLEIPDTGISSTRTLALLFHFRLVWGRLCQESGPLSGRLFGSMVRISSACPCSLTLSLSAYTIP
jgi:hypothetical protein